MFLRLLKISFVTIAMATTFLMHGLANAAAIIKADGSSTVFPITEAMAEEFQSMKKGAVNITVGISGTGGGFKKFCRGETDVQNASRPITSSELDACKKTGIKFFEIPVAYDAIVVAVNPKNNFLNTITIPELKKIWEPSGQGKVNSWKQVNADWPDEKFKLFGAGADSGTFDYFTEAVVGKAKSSRGDYTASEDDNTLVTGVANDKNAIGFLPLSYYMENTSKLKALRVVNNKTNVSVMPSKATVENGTYAPLSRPIFIYVNERSIKRAEVKEFVKFYIENSATIVPQVKYVSLPGEYYKLGLKRIEDNKLGSVFGGHSEIGMGIDQLLKKEGVM